MDTRKEAARLIRDEIRKLQAALDLLEGTNDGVVKRMGRPPKQTEEVQTVELTTPQKKKYANPEFRKKMRDIMKKRWRDHREQMLKHVTKGGKAAKKKRATA